MAQDKLTRTGAQRVLAAVGFIVAWAWTLVSGGGGLVLLITKGPWPLTNGWFALAGGIAACPLTVPAVRKLTGVTLSWVVRLSAVVVFFVAGHIALGLSGAPNWGFGR